MNSKSEGLPFRSLSVRTVLFLVACVLAYILDHYAEVLTAKGERHPGLTQSLFSARGVYQYLVASWPRRLVPRYTVLVEIDPDADPAAVSLYSICEQRELLARLITALADHDPAVIVVDKYFTAGACKRNHPGTAALQKAIRTVSRRVPIIVGIRINERGSPSTVSGQFGWPIVSAVSFPGAPMLKEGVINIDLDSRRLALGWTILRDVKSGTEWRNALALEAALAYDSRLLIKHPSLQRLITKRNNPYVSVIRADDFPSYLAGDLLCASREQQSVIRDLCARRENRNSNLQYIRGRIAIIGEIARDQDMHFAVIGRVPGVVLQANYVEALLDERYYSPVSPWVDYLIGFLFFLALEVALHQKSPLRALICFIAVIVITLFMLSLTVRHLGYYVNPVTVSTLVLAGKLIVWISERIVQKGEVKHEA